MTILIHHMGSSNLSVLLTQLQSQLDTNSDIYIVDATLDRNGLKIAKLYGSTRCFIFVEVGRYNKQQAIDFATQSMQENKQDGLLVIDENCVVSSTFISNIKKAKGFAIVSPVVIKTPYPQFPSNFKWYNPTTKDIRETSEFSEYCYFTKPYEDAKIGLLTNETVICLPFG